MPVERTCGWPIRPVLGRAKDMEGCATACEAVDGALLQAPACPVAASHNLSKVFRQLCIAENVDVGLAGAQETFACVSCWRHFVVAFRCKT